MKANELRVGNFIYHNICGEKQVLKIINITDYAVNLDISNGEVSDQIDFDEIEPIILTEELIIECGLIKRGNEYSLGDFIGEIFYDGFNYTAGEGCIMGEPILYLHQLQNIYFALTNEELNINL